MKLKSIIYFILFTILTSCSSDDNSTITSTESEPIPEPIKENIYIFSKNSKTIDLNYYKGDKGEEYPEEAEDFFKKIWSFYNDPLIEKIELRNDSIIINKSNITEKYRYSKNGNDIIIYDNKEKIIIGSLDEKTNNLKIYKNFQSFFFYDENTSESFSSKKSNYGKINYNDIFPLIKSNPKDLKSKEDYIFWGNIEYSFKK